MHKYYILEPLVIQGLSHSVNLGQDDLHGKEVALMPKQDGLTSRAWLVNRGCHSFIIKQSREVLRDNKDQMI